MLSATCIMGRIEDLVPSLKIEVLILLPKVIEWVDCKLLAVAYSFNLRSSSGMLASAALAGTLLGEYLIPGSKLPVKGRCILTAGWV